MNRRQFLTLLILTSIAKAEAPTAADEAAAIAAVKIYLEQIRTKDFAGLYERHFHSAGKAKTTKDDFVKAMQGGFSATLEQLCVDLLAAHEKKELKFGSEGAVPHTIALELNNAKKQVKADVIKPGNAIRLQIAPDPKELKFYDVD